MKKFFLIIMIFALAACSKEGRTDDSIAESYLSVIGSDYIPDHLIALEAALLYDGYGYYTDNSDVSSYDCGGKSLRTPGVSWTVNSMSKVSGMKITCTGPDTWDLFRKGPYSFSDTYKDDGFVTTCTMTAVMVKDLGGGHYDWSVTFSGVREERDGFACMFHSEPLMTFTCTKSDSARWDSLGGSAILLITQDGEKVDMARMDYLGTDSRFVRGL